MPVKEPSPKYSQLLKRNKELEAIQIRFEGSNLCRLVDAYDAFKAALQGVAEGDCHYGDGCPDTATRHGKCYPCKAREALKHDYTPVFNR